VRVRRDFSWEGARNWLAGLPGGRGLNIAYEAVDRHAEGPRAGQVAVRCDGVDGRTAALTYAELRGSTNRFAHVLRTVGVGAGDRVLTLTGAVPELYVTAFGAWKNGSVFGALPVDLSAEAVLDCLRRTDAAVLVTTVELYKEVVAPIRDRLRGLGQVLVVGDGTAPAGTTNLQEAMSHEREEFEVALTGPDDLALLQLTRGTTGPPRITTHTHDAVVAFHATALYCLDLHGGDVAWCTTDPAGVAGVAYGVVAPLTHGTTLVVGDPADVDQAEGVDHADGDGHGAGDQGAEARRCYQRLQDQRITVWLTTPHLLRRLRRHGADLARAYDLSALRYVASVGDPLDADLVMWTQQAFGRPAHDSWWQAEAGAIMISNFASMDIRPGSMGRPVPGVKAALLARGADGTVQLQDGEVREVADPDEIGELALQPGWPSMFRGYLGGEPDHERRFVAGWYLTGDLARRDNDGFLWYVGRASTSGAPSGDGRRGEPARSASSG
jgi:acetyl-CoA synthetase